MTSMAHTYNPSRSIGGRKGSVGAAEEGDEGSGRYSSDSACRIGISLRMVSTAIISSRDHAMFFLSRLARGGISMHSCTQSDSAIFNVESNSALLSAAAAAACLFPLREVPLRLLPLPPLICSALSVPPLRCCFWRSSALYRLRAAAAFPSSSNKPLTRAVCHANST